jgi:hypothetical protein
MRNSNKPCVLVALTIILAWLPVYGEDHTEVSNLTGRYGLSAFQSCMQTPRGQPPATGFDPNTGALLQPGEVLSAVLNGVISFDAQGNVSVTNALLSDLFHDKTNIGDIPFSAKTPVSCSGHYLREDESLSFTMDCVAQVPPALTISIGPFQIEGFVGINERSITISSIEANILKEKVSVGGNIVAQRDRVCLLQGALNKLQE